MWIVRLALRRAYTFVVAAFVLLLFAFSLFSTSAALAAEPGSVASAQAPRVVTILALGDSVTAGYGLPSEQSFPSVLESLLRKGGHAVKVINAGVSGDTTAEGRARLAGYFPSAAPSRPDIVIVALGANDGLQGKDPAQVEENLDAMLTWIQAEGAKILLIGARAVRGKSPEYRDAFAAVFPRQAAKHHATLYPLLGTGIFGKQEFIQPDGAHPNEKGAQIIAGNLYPLVVELIAKTAQ
ncbi:MAG: arylesterase [Humidesulfovibrio sp.]|nr:arylesterase [Humidesulfovibrio sp.]